jgi:hypothetical protein
MMLTILEFALSIAIVTIAFSLSYRALRGEYTICDFVRQVIILTLLGRFLLMLLPFWARVTLIMCLAAGVLAHLV